MGFKQDVAGTPTPSLFIFDTETGSIAAWTPGTTTAVTMWTTPHAIFKGLALARVHGRGAMLFAADFGNNAVDVFNNRFHPVNTHGRFRDPRLPHSFEWFELVVGVPLILGTFGAIVWFTGFNRDDRALFRKHEVAA